MKEDSGARLQRGIQSIEVGGQLLRALVHHGSPMTLTDLARDADMAPAKAHPYLVSFGRLGLIDQDRDSGRYRLGPLSVQLGLIGLQQNNPVQIASALIDELALRTGQTIAIAVWGDRGATIVRIAESPAAVHVVMRHGTVFSLANTASGRVFGAYRDAADVKALLEQERVRLRQHQRSAPALAPGMPVAAALPTWREFSSALDEVRRHGLSRSEGEVVTGVNALSAPVFDHAGQIVLAITAIGAAGLFDSRWDGPLASAVKACADQISQRLGAPPG